MQRNSRSVDVNLDDAECSETWSDETLSVAYRHAKTLRNLAISKQGAHGWKRTCSGSFHGAKPQPGMLFEILALKASARLLFRVTSKRIPSGGSRCAKSTKKSWLPFGLRNVL